MTAPRSTAPAPARARLLLVDNYESFTDPRYRDVVLEF